MTRVPAALGEGAEELGSGQAGLGGTEPRWGVGAGDQHGSQRGRCRCLSVVLSALPPPAVPEPALGTQCYNELTWVLEAKHGCRDPSWQEGRRPDHRPIVGSAT